MAKEKTEGVERKLGAQHEVRILPSDCAAVSRPADGGVSAMYRCRATPRRSVAVRDGYGVVCLGGRCGIFECVDGRRKVLPTIVTSWPTPHGVRAGKTIPRTAEVRRLEGTAAIVRSKGDGAGCFCCRCDGQHRAVRARHDAEVHLVGFPPANRTSTPVRIRSFSG